MTAATTLPEHVYPASRYAWFVVGILFVLAILSYTDRYVLTLLVDPIKSELGVSDVQISILLGTAFALVYGVLGIFMGYLSDRFNRRNLIFVGIIIWSLATIACGLVRNFQELFLARTFVGIGEAVLTPAAISLISDYFVPEKRGTAVGAYLMGIPLGGGIAVMVGGAILGAVDRGYLRPVIEAAGEPWRAVMIILGIPGLILSPIVFLIREPKRFDDGGWRVGADDPVTTLSSSLAVWMRIAPIFLAVAGIAMAEAAVVAWSPSILIRDLNVPADESGLLVGLSFAIGGTAGVLLGGILGDRAKARGGKSARIRVCILGAMLTLPCAAFGLSGSVAITLIVMCLYRIFSDWTTSCGISAILDYVPNRLRGLATSITFFLNVSIGFGVGPTLVALVSSRHIAGVSGMGASVFAVAIPILLVVIALFAFTPGAVRSPRLKTA